MGKNIVRNHNLRREIAEYVLSCTDQDLLSIICALEEHTEIPSFFSCEKCRRLFGKCEPERNHYPNECLSKIYKYEEMRDTV